jgi:steroid 5-alpha reductase family enzyme
MEFMLQELLPLIAASLGVAMGAVVLLWLISIPLRDVSIIDMLFAVILLAITAVAFQLGAGADGRKLLVFALVGIWALRITFHVVRRNWGHGEDARYTKLRSWAQNERSFYWLSLRRVFLLQGIVLWLVSLPVQFAMAVPEPATLGWAALAGTILWAVGFFTEWIADVQLRRFRADPGKRGTVLDTGLWKYSRHPNYFGELCVWWGIFLVTCDHPLGWITIIGPIVYSHLVINVTGQRTLDKKLAREKPGYREYMETTSGLVPWPPRRRRA